MFGSTSESLKRSLLRGRPNSKKSKPLAPLRAVERVERSWTIVSEDLEGLGIDFFTRVFLDVPDAMDLFLSTLSMTPEEMKRIKESQVEIIHFVKKNKLIKAHARLVIMETGRCVAGLYDMTVLVPRLRSLGRMHGAAGVGAAHYGIFFKHLMAAVKDRISSSGSGVWDSATEEAWGTVRDCMSRILSQPDDAVGSLDGGRLNRWGAICGAASVYACVATPLRVAGMVGYSDVVGSSFSLCGWMGSLSGLGFFEFLNNFGFAFLDALVVLIFLVELVLGKILMPLVDLKSLRKVRNISTRKFQRANFFGKGLILIQWLGIHEAVMFPITNMIFIASYLLQYQHVSLFGQGETVVGGGESTTAGVVCDVAVDDVGLAQYHLMNNGSSPFTTGCVEDILNASSPSMAVGVHWAWAFGVLRLVAIFRAMYAIRRMELSYTIKGNADAMTRLTMRTCRLVLGLAYTSHVAACLYVLVARIELGPKAHYDASSPEALATPFFPDPTILARENGMLTNYLRCVHFAFTNLAGIGNHDSTPYSALECMFTLVVNALGATLYAFTTGLLLSMIEPAAERANQFGESAATLTQFMSELGMTADDQDRMIQGFILREMSSGGKPSSGGNGPFASAPGENSAAPAYPEQVVHHLPRYLQDELHTVALVDAMKRRERCFRRCSNDFLTALAASLKQSVTLLPGDYIVREGSSVPTQLLIVEQGTLEVVVDGNYVRTFERGDMISFHWVESLTRSSFVLTSATRHPSGSGTFSPLLLSEPIAGASVRSMDHCKIATGLPSKEEKRGLRKKYPSDWKELVEVLDNARGQRKSRTSIKEDDAAPIVVSQSVYDAASAAILDTSVSRRSGRTKSLVKQVRKLRRRTTIEA